MLVAAAVPVQVESIDTHYCPYEAIGYVRVIKDGYRIAGGEGLYDPRTFVLKAWFPERSAPMVAMTLDLRTGGSGRIAIHAEGKGSIRQRHGTFCAFDNEVIKLIVHWQVRQALKEVHQRGRYFAARPALKSLP
jgi:hypothetical protein